MENNRIFFMEKNVESLPSVLGNILFGYTWKY